METIIRFVIAGVAAFKLFQIGHSYVLDLDLPPYAVLVFFGAGVLSSDLIEKAFDFITPWRAMPAVSAAFALMTVCGLTSLHSPYGFAYAAIGAVGVVTTYQSSALTLLLATRDPAAS